MSPKKSAKKATAVDAMKAELSKRSLPFTAEGIEKLQAMEGSAITKPLVDACSYTLKRKEPGSIDQFKGLKGADRFAHLSRFMLDPSSGGLQCVANYTSTVAVKTRRGWEFEDLTEAQLASGTWLNCAQHAKAIVQTLDKVGDSAGVQLYRYWFFKGGHTNENVEAASASASASMSVDAFTVASEEMRGVPFPSAAPAAMDGIPLMLADAVALPAAAIPPVAAATPVSSDAEASLESPFKRIKMEDGVEVAPATRPR